MTSEFTKEADEIKDMNLVTEPFKPAEADWLRAVWWNQARRNKVAGFILESMHITNRVRIVDFFGVPLLCYFDEASRLLSEMGILPIVRTEKFEPEPPDTEDEICVFLALDRKAFENSGDTSNIFQLWTRISMETAKKILVLGHFPRPHAEKTEAAR